MLAHNLGKLGLFTSEGAAPVKVCSLGSIVFAAYCSEIGSFAAAARAAAVVLVHSLTLEERDGSGEKFKPANEERQQRKGPPQCFIRIRQEEHSTLWRVYQPKFPDGKLMTYQDACHPPMH